MRSEDLSPLIAEIDILRAELGYERWSYLSPWCDQANPLTADGDTLERLYERLCMRWADSADLNGEQLPLKEVSHAQAK